mmetsp:Transcript_23745/g.51433  ORF Transcript_23745/g.51433 Transcript_23745/m.51433 type:complete len:530 (+) Transcript_23745:307-1896(+)|eukprot:CAMPEP_0178518576 /NCGR_PEP_ID=MMETSP0696-20121128/26343_1 /TAXON_ID=265572 /ORGANISM="Extubocellulus spinifer, Strain CCMP396" /LENGTH=529 /DNA_ID=CAMNT_0020149173 /DNA_START=46 /DNA_END=1635 /DNA_ORIENTATION=-
MSINQPETDIDAAATLLGFRSSCANPETLDPTEKDAVGAAAAATGTPPQVVHILPPGPLPKTAATPKGAAQKAVAPPKNAVPKFPARLMEMLSDEENTDCISWMPHGRSFLIHDPYKFTDTVLPKYFKGTKFSSFTRKLYRWGFRQISKGPDADTFFHKLFRRDKKTLCDRMICKEEIRDGCPELHVGINAYSLMRMEQSDMLQEMIRKKEDAAKAAERIAAVDAVQKKAASEMAARSSPVVATGHEQQRHANMTGQSTKRRTSSPKDVPVRAQASTLSMETSLGLMKRHLAQIRKRRSDLQRLLRAQIQKKDTITQSKRRYAQLLTSQERLSPSMNDTRPSLPDIQQMQMQIQQMQHAQMNASRAAAPRAAPTHHQELQHAPRSVPQMPAISQGPVTMPTLQGVPRRVSSPPPAAFPEIADKLVTQHAGTGTGTIGAYYPDANTKRYDATKPSSISQRVSEVGMGVTKHRQINDASHAMASTQAMATFKAALQHQFQRSVDHPRDEQNVVAAGVIQRALENLRRQGLA